MEEVLLRVSGYNGFSFYRGSIGVREAMLTAVQFQSPGFSKHHPDQSAASNIKARPSTRLRRWLAFFSKKVLFN